MIPEFVTNYFCRFLSFFWTEIERRNSRIAEIRLVFIGKEV